MLIDAGPTPFEWASDHIHMVGWGTVIALAVWLWRQSINFIVEFKESRKASKTAMEQINQLATTHFPQMQANLSGLDEKTQEANKILASIDKGITVLVDRGHSYSGPERRSL